MLSITLKTGEKVNIKPKDIYSINTIDGLKIYFNFNPDHDPSNGEFADGGGGGGGSDGSSGSKDGNVKLSEDQLAAVNTYHTSAFLIINRTARGQDGLSVKTSGYKDTIKNLDSAITSSKTSSENIVYRGIAKSAGDNLSLKVGDVYKDKGFVSTSLDKSVADKFGGSTGYVVKLSVPKGTAALPTNKISGFSDKWGWNELLLGRGTSMKITNISPGDNNIIIEAKVIK